ncbi:energy transducer TonB [Parerythrobacter lacustris]|uniref:Energy transducer TonB n=1 Tax=Parerythrobacter lacustris TaxID=2969984 RepID=A0ABT1XQC8_9SPHN|nr:energy transducer TonB [Parerythrobacter lacustris]MCR2833870.1 energy transducer TonB [Parerythrobacter lacustris]
MRPVNAFAAACLMICLATQVTGANAQPQVGITQTPDWWSKPWIDLHGAARLDFDPDDAAFAKFGSNFDDDQRHSVELAVGSDGVIKSCRVGGSATSNELVSFACAQLRNSGSVSIPAGYDMAGWQGRLTVEFGASELVETEIVQPVMFTDAQDGVEILVVTSTSRGIDAPVDCETFAIVGEPFLTDDSFEAVCAAFLSADAETQAKCRKEAPYGDEQPYYCRFVTRSLDPVPMREVYVTIRESTSYRPPAYPPKRDFETSVLGESKGEFIVRYDYPARALRSEWEGRVMIIVGVGANGNVVSCRPLETSGFAFLDNEACSQMLRRGRYEFAEGIERPAGTAYTLQPVVWAIPD